MCYTYRIPFPVHGLPIHSLLGQNTTILTAEKEATLFELELIRNHEWIVRPFLG